MSRLEELRIKNPGIRFYSVKDKEFARYGCIVEHDFSGIAEMAKKLPFLVEGSKYEASIGAFEIHPSAEVAKEELYGELDIQIGNCWGYNSYLNALEWHKNSEINVAATISFLFSRSSTISRTVSSIRRRLSRSSSRRVKRSRFTPTHCIIVRVRCRRPASTASSYCRRGRTDLSRTSRRIR